MMIDINRDIFYDKDGSEYPFSIIDDFAEDNIQLDKELHAAGVYDNLPMISNPEYEQSRWSFKTHMAALAFARRFNTWRRENGKSG